MEQVKKIRTISEGAKSGEVSFAIPMNQQPTNIFMPDVGQNIGQTENESGNVHARPFRPKSMTFQNLRYEVPVNRRKGIRFCGDKKPILKSVSGEFKAGQLHAILGPR